MEEQATLSAGGWWCYTRSYSGHVDIIIINNYSKFEINLMNCLGAIKLLFLLPKGVTIPESHFRHGEIMNIAKVAFPQENVL